MEIDYIIVQAGGKGTRLKHLTANKPKTLVPVGNLPILFHLFHKFPDKQFLIIADYKKEVMREYLEAFAKVQYQVVDATGTGTCSGIKQALDLIAPGKSFMLIWSDLILADDFQLPENIGDYIGISRTFPCRWSYKDGIFSEEKIAEKGIAGLFIFQNKANLENIPESGELVRWFSDVNMQFDKIFLDGTKEFGLFSEYEKLCKEKCRPFNKMSRDGDILTKEGITEQGHNLAKLESKWYQAAISKNVAIIPKIYGVNPIRMEYIEGKNIYEYSTLEYDKKRSILKKLTNALKNLHQLDCIPADTFSIKEAYYGKTMARLHTIRDLLPFADQKSIRINGKECRNVYFYKRDFERKIDAVRCDKFAFIHGDCTFSNMMLRNDADPVLIDPRGYFGFTEIYGDPNYDWAKLYYSIIGNYDRFNLKDYRLNIGKNSVELKIESNGWEDMEEDFYVMSATEPKTIKLLHAVIWLSLTTYAWQDYDSICGAFYNGLYYLEDVL